MLGLSGFFKNIQNSLAKEIIFKTTIKDIIKKQTNIDVSLENIYYKNEVITLKNINSTALSVIFIKKQKILEEILNSQKINLVKDIR